jgi:small subunit ribosomal protein S20
MMRAGPERYGLFLCSPEPTLPNIKAAIKWQRQTERRTLRNLSTKTKLRTLFKKAKAAPEIAGTVEAAFDKAARKGIIHPNKAARKKARLARAIRAAATAALAAPVATAAGKKRPAGKKR